MKIFLEESPNLAVRYDSFSWISFSWISEVGDKCNTCKFPRHSSVSAWNPISETRFEHSCLLTIICHSTECSDDGLPPFSGEYALAPDTFIFIKLHELAHTNVESD